MRKTIVIVTHDIDEAIKLGDRVALLNVGGIVEQYAPPDEILAAPASEFVERFVGDDRSSKRLTLAHVSDLPFSQGPVVDVGASAAEIQAAKDAYRTDWVGVTQDGTFLGWVDTRSMNGSGLADRPREQPAAQVMRRQQPAPRDGDHHDVRHLGGRHRRRRPLRGGGDARGHPRRPGGAHAGAGDVNLAWALPLQSSEPLIRWNYISDQWDDIQSKLIDHIELTLLSVFFGLILSSILAGLALRYRWTAGPITTISAVIYTIPSVALFGILVPYTGLSKLPAVIALTGYTFLVLVTSIISGFRAVPRSVRDAADGMGLSPRRRVMTVELPLALPYIMTGIRVATVTTVGLVTIASIIGQGGLGNLILDGLQRTYWTPMIVGAVLSVALALVLDLLLWLLGRAVTPWAKQGRV